MYRKNRQCRQSLQNEHSEDFRIGIDIIFRDFCADANVTEYTFRPNLTNVERKYIHEKCRRLGLKSKSKGKEPNRVLSMFKNVKTSSSNFELKLSNESSQAIDAFVLRNCGGPRPNFNNLHEIVKYDTSIGRLNFSCAPMVKPPRSGDYDDFRRNLPIYELKDYILSTIEHNSVTIISGETGSGKTTQVPQYILENHCNLNKPCRVICTQPRRISTVAVAERVSIERGERVGETCGYQIKLDHKIGISTALVYCTTGVLLRTLMGGFDVLNNITHIIIDEIHERDKFTDFVLISLRECLLKYPYLRLILMSATLDVDLFENYFTNIAKINVKGRTYPIEHYFLDRILIELNYESEQMKLIKLKAEDQGTSSDNNVQVNTIKCQVDEHLLHEMDEALVTCMDDASEENFMQILYLILSDDVPVDQSERHTGYTPLIVAAAKGHLDYVNQLLHLGADISIKCKAGKTAVDWANQMGHFGAAKIITDFDVMKKVSQSNVLGLYNQTILEDIIDHNLIVAIITHIHRTSTDSMGVLVFLPGYEDIMALYDVLGSSPIANALKICVLHGSMMINAQHDVFKRSNMRKVILSTNVAETSITIDDIAHVIDTGKVKQKSYDSLSGTSTLETTWISIASLKQRAGRAGRCSPGKCYHLFSRNRYESLLVNTVPEILTVPLHELCLQTKLLAPQGMKIADFLSKALEAPSGNAIESAITGLVSLGALDAEENLTILGSHLLKLCIEPHLGKMLLYSVVLKCLDPVLTIVATLAHKEPFVLPTKGFEKVEACQKKKSLTFGTLSDHMGLLMAFQQWQKAKLSYGEQRFCKEYYVSSSCLEMISVTRNHILTQLRAAGFVHYSYGISEVTAFSKSWPVIKAAICAGLYPNVAFSHKNKIMSRNEKRVLMHSTSCVRGTLEYASGLWFIFEEMSKLGNLCNLKGVTAVTPLTVVLTAGSKIDFDESTANMQIDDSFAVNIYSDSVWKFRLAIDSVIQKHITRPSTKNDKFETEVLDTLHTALSAEDSCYKLVQPSGIGDKPMVSFTKMNGIASKVQESREASRSGNSAYQRWDGRRHNTSFNNEARNYQKHSLNRSNQHGFASNHQSRMNSCAVNDMLQDCNSTDSSWASTSGSYSQESRPHHNQRFGLSNNALIDILIPKNIVIGEIARFYVIRPLEVANIQISLSQGTWHFAPHTERRVFQSLLQGCETYLFYNVRGSTIFQAAAKLLSTNQPANIEWITTSSVGYDEVMCLLEPKPNFLEDGYEIPYGAGLKIIFKMMKRNSQRPKYGRPILETPERQHINPKRKKWRPPYRNK